MRSRFRFPMVVGSICIVVQLIAAGSRSTASPVQNGQGGSRPADSSPPDGEPIATHAEAVNEPYVAPPPRDRGAGGSPRTWERGRFQSIQINVDPDGANIPGDAANEPSLAVDPTNPLRMVIGFRQFDTVESDWRKSGWAYSHDGGNTWTFPGVLIDDFGSDPVLAADAEGTFYYFRHAGHHQFCTSPDGGLTWSCGECPYGKGDKPWMTVDRTQGPGRGNIYASWSGYEPGFTRSTDGGSTFMAPLDFGTHWGTLAVGVDGELYMTSNGGILRSSNAQFHDQIPRFELERSTWISAEFGNGAGWRGPNPLGLMGQPWVDVDRSDGSFRGNVYVLGSIRGRVPFQRCGDPLDVRFTRSSDRGEEWSRPRRITDFPPRLNSPW